MTETKKFVKGETRLQLTGLDGNAFALLGAAQKAGRQAGWTTDEKDEFFAEAQSGNYDHLLQTCMTWFDVR
jgi:hypothetical protein